MTPARLMLIRSTKTYGGPERQILGFARRLDPRLFRPVVCTFTDTLGKDNPFLRMAESQAMETALVRASASFDTQSIRHLTEIAGTMGIDLLCPQDYRANLYAVLAGRRLGIPVVATMHGYTSHTLKVWLYDRFDRLVLHFANRVVCVSEALRRLARRWGIPTSRLHRVYNSIDTTEVDRGTAPDRDHDHAHPVVCTVGRLSLEKGHRFLIHAWRRVTEQLPSARLILVGDGPERAALEDSVASMGLESSVTFAGFTDSPMDYIRGCDVFVLPSLTEGLPVALLEACASGKPVVASEVGGVGEVVTSGQSGLLVRAGRTEELADALTDLLAHPEISMEMGKRGRMVVEDKFCFDKNVPRLQEVYMSCLNAEKRAA